jgi:IclR family transcriptional regulator, pca regulon regulatory protein
MSDGAVDRRAAGERNPSNLYVASVEKAFRVLDTLTRAGRALGLSELAVLTGLGKSATQRFVFTLRALGYVDQDASTKAYCPSTKMLELGRAYVGVEVVREKAAPFLAAANRRTEETVNLTVLDGEEVVYVLRYPSRHVVSVNLSVGSRLPAYCTAPGRAILAHLEEEEVERIIGSSQRLRRTRFTVTQKAALRKILKEVHASGFCISNQEAFVGDISTAAPVFDHTGQVVAAVNIAVPWPRWSPGQVQQRLTPIVIKTARLVSAALGYRAIRGIASVV